MDNTNLTNSIKNNITTNISSALLSLDSMVYKHESVEQPSISNYRNEVRFEVKDFDLKNNNKEHIYVDPIYKIWELKNEVNSFYQNQKLILDYIESEEMKLKQKSDKLNTDKTVS